MEPFLIGSRESPLFFLGLSLRFEFIILLTLFPLEAQAEAEPFSFYSTFLSDFPFSPCSVLGEKLLSLLG